MILIEFGLIGYFLNENLIGVLSIPDFHESGDGVLTFQSAITTFLTRSKASGMKKIVIDLQYNTGGQTFLAIDTFKQVSLLVLCIGRISPAIQFFPTIDPFNGNRLRAHHAADVMGNAITSYWNSLTENDDDYYALAANEWLALDRLNADTNQNFTTWDEFFGPHDFDGDNFTTTVSSLNSQCGISSDQTIQQRYNFSSFIFDVEGTGGDVPFAVYGYDAYPADTTQPYAAEDIIIVRVSVSLKQFVANYSSLLMVTASLPAPILQKLCTKKQE